MCTCLHACTQVRACACACVYVPYVRVRARVGVRAWCEHVHVRVYMGVRVRACKYVFLKSQPCMRNTIDNTAPSAWAVALTAAVWRVVRHGFEVVRGVTDVQIGFEVCG